MIIDTEVRLIFPEFYKNNFYDNNRNIFEKIINNKIDQKILYKTSEKYLWSHSKKNLIKINWICGLPFGLLKNIKKQHNYFKELRDKREIINFFLLQILTIKIFQKLRNFYLLIKIFPCTWVL